MANNDVIVPSVLLNDGAELPAIGLGTWKMKGEEAYNAVRQAIELGYRHIDTAVLYGNEEEVGKAVNDAVKAGDCTREELFITSKLWNDHHGDQLVQQSFQESLRRLDQEFLDCYMVHWPWPQKGLFVESYAALAKIQGLGQLRSIAVANFNESQLDAIISATGIAPVLNQVELHPGFSQAPLREFHQKHGIVTEAWSPLSQGTVVDNPVLADIAARYDKSVAQIVLRWMVQLGVSPVPKSANAQRQADNLQIFDFELEDADMAAITALDTAEGSGRLYADPATFPGDEGV